MIDPPAKLKLPVFATLLLAYQLQFSNFGVFVRLAWLPFVICCVTGTLAAANAPTIVDGETQQTWQSFQLFVFLGWLSTIPAVTAWHRFVILGPDDPSARIRYEIGKTEISYFIAAVVLFVSMLLVATFFIPFLSLVVDLKDVVNAESLVVFGLLYVLGMLIGLLAIARFLPVLPARAIGEQIRFRDCSRLTRGNGLRIAALYILAIAPEYLVSEFLWLIVDGGETEALHTFSLGSLFIRHIMGNIVTFFFFTITISVLSIAYKFVVMPQLPERID